MEAYEDFRRYRKSLPKRLFGTRDAATLEAKLGRRRKQLMERMHRRRREERRRGTG